MDITVSMSHVHFVLIQGSRRSGTALCKVVKATIAINYVMALRSRVVWRYHLQCKLRQNGILNI